MTNYIEEMMRTAGVKYFDRYYSCIENKDLECKNECCICDKAKEIFCYPDFTSEKQLEITKLVGELDYTSFGSLLDYEINVNDLDFTQALAKLTSELMNAGELDKEKVKEILER